LRIDKTCGATKHAERQNIAFQLYLVESSLPGQDTIQLKLHFPADRNVSCTQHLPDEKLEEFLD